MATTTRKNIEKLVFKLADQAAQELIDSDYDYPCQAQMEICELLHESWKNGTLSSTDADELDGQFNKLVAEAHTRRLVGA